VWTPVDGAAAGMPDAAAGAPGGGASAMMRQPSPVAATSPPETCGHSSRLSPASIGSGPWQLH